MNINNAVTNSVIVRTPQNSVGAAPSAEAAPVVQSEVFVKSEAAATETKKSEPKSEPKPAPKPEFDPVETTPRRDGDDGPGLGGGYPPVLENLSRSPRVLAEGVFEDDGPTLGGGYFATPEAEPQVMATVVALPYDESEMLLFGC